MNGWLDWEEIEKHNDWGVREKGAAMGELWDKGADGWDERWKAEEAFTKAQADAIDVLPTDTVLDICCGAGPLAVNLAPRVARVIACDYGDRMLEHVRSNALARGLSNVETLKADWFAGEPGEIIPVCDVAVTRWSPAQGNILRFSRFATRRCYSIATCAPYDGSQPPRPAGKDGRHFWLRSTTDASLNETPRPNGRKYGYNVHFNILYDHGANPTLTYVSNGKGMTVVVMGWDPGDVRY